VSRLLLTIMSIVAQILSGFWSNSALCLRSDGTICCVHDLAGSCSCCEHDHDGTPWDGGHSDDGHRICAIAGSHDHTHGEETPPEARLPLELPLSSNEPCGCRHLPLSSGAAPSSQRMARVTSSDRMHYLQRTSRHCDCRWMRPELSLPVWTLLDFPRCLAVGLTIVSSTVIRC